MERMQRSMTTYIKSLSKVKEAEDKEKLLPIAYMGSTMVTHADDFDPDSEFGQCLSCMIFLARPPALTQTPADELIADDSSSSFLAFGRANERIARTQENYVNNATSSWLESVERSLAQMKEYQVWINDSVPVSPARMLTRLPPSSGSPQEARVSPARLRHVSNQVAEIEA